jgi:hypothetical protein
MSATNTDNIPKINLEEFFKPKVDELLAEINDDRRLVEDYVSSGLTESEFAKQRGISRRVLQGILYKYNIPAHLIDSYTIRRIRSRARKTCEQILTSKCDCISAQLLRQEFERQERRAGGDSN